MGKGWWWPFRNRPGPVGFGGENGRVTPHRVQKKTKLRETSPPTERFGGVVGPRWAPLFTLKMSRNKSQARARVGKVFGTTFL